MWSSDVSGELGRIPRMRARRLRVGATGCKSGRDTVEGLRLVCVFVVDYSHARGLRSVVDWAYGKGDYVWSLGECRH